MDIKKETNFFSIHPHVKIYPFLTSTLFHYILKYYKLGFGYTFLYPIQGRIQKGIYFYSLFGYFIYPKSYIYIFSILIFISKTSYMFFLLNKSIFLVFKIYIHFWGIYIYTKRGIKKE